VLRSLGYEEFVEEVPSDDHPHAQSWVRKGSGSIDLHRTILGVGVDDLSAWEVLARETEAFELRGVPCEVLGVSARIVHVCLHAAQHAGVMPTTLGDLERAIRRTPRGDWVAAASVARELGALRAFVAGLQLAPGGQELIRDLGLNPVADVAIALRRADLKPGELRVALLWEELGTASTRDRLRILWRKLFPSLEYMRAWSKARGGSERTGPVAVAYLVRIARNLSSLRQAASAVRKVRAATGADVVRRGSARD
jgi:hypothetical protein